jgi:hypothetical protein
VKTIPPSDPSRQAGSSIRIMSFPLPPFPPAHETRAPQLIAVTVTVTVLAVISVAARLYVRVKISRSVGWDDYTILAAMVGHLQRACVESATVEIEMQVILLLSMAMIGLQVHYGVGRHMFGLLVKDLVRAGLYFHITEILYIPGSALIKISACLFLLRIMARGTSPSLRGAVYVLMSVIVVLSVATVLMIILRCVPIEAGWDPRIPAKCLSYAQVLHIGYAQGGEHAGREVMWSIKREV